MSEQARCRGCNIELRGKPYHLGYSYVSHPVTKKQVKVSFYGDYVCSFDCDYRVLLDMQNSMPGGMVSHLVNREYLQNWDDEK
jgi:hypothetical protein